MKILFAVRRADVEHLGVMTLVSVLRGAGHDADVVPARPTEVDRKLRSGRYRVVGYSVPTLDLEYYLTLNRQIKRRHPGVLSLLGGPHPTFDPGVIQQEGVDAICRGEGEEALVELADLLERGAGVCGVRNLWVKEGGRVHKNPLRPLITDLDTIPWPDRGCFPRGETYTRGKMHVMVSRGCPHGCTYCANPAQRRLYGSGTPAVRWRSVDNVMAELRAAVCAGPRPRLVMFEDDLFAASSRWTKEFLQRYDRQVGIPFFCYLRPEQVTPELVHGLAGAGCVTISMGIEVANEALRRDLLGRRTTNRQILRAARLVKTAGMRLEALNIVGIPGTPPDTDLETVRLNARCKVDFAAAKLLAPYPGTEVRRRAQREGRLTRRFPGSSWRSSMRFDDLRQRRAAENLQRLFGIAVEWPRLLPLWRLLIRLPVDRPYRLVGLLWEGFAASTRLYPVGPRGIAGGLRKYGALLGGALRRHGPGYEQIARDVPRGVG